MGIVVYFIIYVYGVSVFSFEDNEVCEFVDGGFFVNLE